MANSDYAHLGLIIPSSQQNNLKSFGARLSQLEKDGYVVVNYEEDDPDKRIVIENGKIKFVYEKSEVVTFPQLPFITPISLIDDDSEDDGNAYRIQSISLTASGEKLLAELQALDKWNIFKNKLGLLLWVTITALITSIITIVLS